MGRPPDLSYPRGQPPNLILTRDLYIGRLTHHIWASYNRYKFAGTAPVVSLLLDNREFLHGRGQQGVGTRVPHPESPPGPGAAAIVALRRQRRVSWRTR